MHAWQTTRHGGYSLNGFSGFNLSNGVADNPKYVMKNRQLLKEELGLPAEPCWIKLVHGTRVVDAAKRRGLEEADAIYTNLKNNVLVIPTADCLPVLLCSTDGSEIAAAHAGWRSLAGGVLENTIEKFHCKAKNLHCWLGPAISVQRFEVGEEVLGVFLERYPNCASSFRKSGNKKYHADLYSLARLALNESGVSQIIGGRFCTYDDHRFFSYRRQGKNSGRMVSLIWRS